MKISILFLTFFYSAVLAGQTDGTLLLKQLDMKKTHIIFIYGGDVWH
ncbi:hypothetical protein N8328_00255 [Crocinitomicaceae bacterium]|nr:hypothetical protein [Crocinitomicaceae bacterium]